MRRHLATSIYGLLIAVVIGLAVAVHFFGISIFVITGASMTGEISKGSLAFDRDVPVGSLQVGDVITFQPPGTKDNVTHRIIGITSDENGDRVFRTKGDYNETEDPWMFTLDRPVQAKYVASIPWLGYVLAAFTMRVVRTVVLAVVGLLILAVTIMWLRSSSGDDDGEEAAGQTLSNCAPDKRMNVYPSGGMTVYQSGEVPR